MIPIIPMAMAIELYLTTFQLGGQVLGYVRGGDSRILRLLAKEGRSNVIQ